MSRRRKKNQTGSRPMYWQTAAYDKRVKNMFADDLMGIAMSRFKWEGLPDTCDPIYLEQTLLREGVATLAFKNNALLSLRAVQQGAPNMYDMPRAWRAMGQSGRTNFMCNWDNGVFILENKTMYPTYDKILIWAQELADILRVKQINRFHMRMPFAVTVPQGRETDALNFYRQIAQGEPIVLAYDNFNDVKVEMKMPEKGKEYVNDKLDEEFRNTLEMAYRALCVDSMPYKRERMIEDEAVSQAMPMELARLSPLDCRRRAAHKLNAKFGHLLKEPVRCVWNRDIETDNHDFIHKYDSLLGGAQDE